MKPWSCGSIACRPPAMALFTSLSTSARLSQERLRRPSVYLLVSHSSCVVKVLKKGCVNNMTNAWSLTTMHAALSSVNFGLNEKPSEEKKVFDLSRSCTARLRNILRPFVSAIAHSLCWCPLRLQSQRDLD